MMKAQIVGWAHSRFWRLEAPDVRALMAEVIAPALDHAGIGSGDLDAIFVGVFNGGFSPQQFQAALPGMVAEGLGNIPATRVENACATGSAAVYSALDYVESGRGRIALAIGAEKMTAVSTSRTNEILMGGSFLDDGEAEPDTGFAGT